MSDDLNSSLQQLVDHAIERLQRGERVDVDELAAQQPELKERLVELLPTLTLLATLDRTPQEAASPLAGRMLGDYQLVREIGRGGMGIVFEARQISLPRRVAVKVLPHATLLNERARQRFEREAKAASLLSHPHIVPIFGFGCEDGLQYYAMQFIDGENLAEVIRRRQSEACGTVSDALSTKHDNVHESFPPPVSSTLSSAKPTSVGADWFRRVAQIGCQVALGLHHAHEAGVIHRDIKPANLLLDRDDNAWIADFGLARCEEAEVLTVTGDLPGTLRYMSPEQILGEAKDVDRRSDVYSLAATLWELAALRPLHDGASRKELSSQVSAARPPPLRKFCRGASGDLEAVLSKALAKHPAERYATAAEMGEDLAELLRGGRVRARQRGVPRRVVLIGAAGLVATGGIGIGMLQGTTPAAELPADPAFHWELHAVPEVKTMQDERGLHLSRRGVLRNDDFIILKSANPKFTGTDERALDVGSPSKDFAVKLAQNPVTHGYIWKVIAPGKPGTLRDGDTVVFRSENFNFRNDDSGRNLEVRFGAGGAPPSLEVSRVRERRGWISSEKWRIRRVAGAGEVQSREFVCLESLADELGASRWLHGDDIAGNVALSMRSIGGEMALRAKPLWTVVLQATDDAQIHGAYTEQNFDNELSMRGGGTGVVVTGLKFDVSSLSGANIQRAVVRAEWRVADIVTPVHACAFRGAEDWHEETVTWSNMSGGESPLVKAGPILDVALSQVATREDRGKFSEWDVTSEVRGWADGSIVNRGLLFSAPQCRGDAISFFSREELDGTHGAKLIVELRA